MKRTFKAIVVSIISIAFFIQQKVYAQAPKPAPTLQEFEKIFLNGLLFMWALFLLDSLFFLVKYGLKYVFVWAGTVDAQTEVFQDAKDKLGRFGLSLFGMFLIPMIIGIIMRFLWQSSGGSPAGCYDFLAGYNPVFVIYFGSVCQ